MPSEIAAASPASRSVQCAAPTSPGLWHDAQFVLSTGMIAVLNEGLSEPLTFVGGEIWFGIVNFDGLSAVSFIVSVTSSEVLTRPAIEIGPIPNDDIFTFVVAVAVSLPPATFASTV